MTGRRPLVVVAIMSLACGEQSEDPATSDPVLLTRELPFVYPTALYTARVEGDVALRLYIDSLGLVVQESLQFPRASLIAGCAESAKSGDAAKLSTVLVRLLVVPASLPFASEVSPSIGVFFARGRSQ